MVKIAETSTISNYEKSKLAKEDDFLLVGKSDKSIGVVSKGVVIPIKEIAVANRTGTLVGSLSIPTAEGIPFVIQYGLVGTTTASEVKDVVFPVSFANRAFQVSVTPVDSGTKLATSYKPAIVDATKFTLTVVNGGTNELFSWMAIGF